MGTLGALSSQGRSASLDSLTDRRTLITVNQTPLPDVSAWFLSRALQNQTQPKPLPEAHTGLRCAVSRLDHMTLNSPAQSLHPRLRRAGMAPLAWLMPIYVSSLYSASLKVVHLSSKVTDKSSASNYQ